MVKNQSEERKDKNGLIFCLFNKFEPDFGKEVTLLTFFHNLEYHNDVVSLCF